MSVKKKHYEVDTFYFITFTCLNWNELFEITSLSPPLLVFPKVCKIAFHKESYVHMQTFPEGVDSHGSPTTYHSHSRRALSQSSRLSQI